ncbi:MAG: hypothetical protein HY534_03620 [Chloroflexi bacterium]|nr:hypothetical protein [Chloroflexota bacterium]
MVQSQAPPFGSLVRLGVVMAGVAALLALAIGVQATARSASAQDISEGQDISEASYIRIVAPRFS